MKTFSSDDILNRLKLAFSAGSDTELADLLGIKKATLSNWRNRNSLDLPLVFSFCEHINIDWLITGQGKMLKNAPLDSESDIIPSKSSIKNLRVISRSSGDSKKQLRPRIPLDAAAGYLSYFTEGMLLEDCEMLPVIKALPQYDFTIFAKGDSMSPDIISGDELACRFIHESAFIQWGRIYVLDTTQGVVVKRVLEKGSQIIGRSINKEYPDCPIDKADILHMALVIGLIRQL